jgi:hypothetical protein
MWFVSMYGGAVFAVLRNTISRRRGRANVVIPKGFPKMWEGWKAGFMAFHAFHTLPFP